MPFPISFKGSLKIPVKEGGGKVEAVMEGVIAELRKEEARRVQTGNGEVRFRGGIFRLPFWNNRLTAITSGRVTFDRGAGRWCCGMRCG